MRGGSLTKLGLVLVVAGALLMAGPVFGFSTLAADRGVNVGTAATENALLAVNATGETPDQQTDVEVIEITNNVNQAFDPLDTQAEIVDDTNGALAISNGFDGTLDPGTSTGLEMTCAGGGSGSATVQVGATGTASTLRITGVDYTHTFQYDCTGGANGGPTADAGGPYTVYEGESVQLDGTTSTAGTGNLRGYRWEIPSEEGTLQDAGSAEPTYIAPAETSGDSTVTIDLTVTDNNGNTATDTAVITISDGSSRSVIADFTYGTSGNSDNVDLDASPSSAYDGTIVSYEWEADNGEPIADGETASGKIPSGTSVTLTVTTDTGDTDSVTKEID